MKLIGGLGGMLIEELAQVGVALAAVPSDVETFGEFLASASAFVNGLADLAVGDSFADADVHGLNLSAGLKACFK